MTKVTCTCCLEPFARLTLTKKGLPCLSCPSCGSRVFMNSRAALRGLLLLAPEAGRLLEAARTRGMDIDRATADLNAQIAAASSPSPTVAPAASTRTA